MLGVVFVVIQRHLGLLSEEEDEEREVRAGSRKQEGGEWEVQEKEGNKREKGHTRMKIRWKRNAAKNKEREASPDKNEGTCPN